MRARIAVLVALLVVASACGRGPRGEHRRDAGMASSPNRMHDLVGYTGAGAIPLFALVPKGTDAAAVRYLHGSAAIAVTWVRGPGGQGPRRCGVEVWNRVGSRPGRWTVVYEDRYSHSGECWYTLDGGDLTRDGRAEIEIVRELDGSGGCGLYRVFDVEATAVTQLFERHHCDGRIWIRQGRLVVHSSIYRPKDSHCCPSFLRRTSLRWNGLRFVVASRVTRRTEFASG